MKLRLGVRPDGQVYIQFADSLAPSRRGTIVFQSRRDEHDAVAWSELQAEARQRMTEVVLAQVTAGEEGVAS